MCLEAEHDPELRNILENAALVVPESSGIFWASKVLGKPLQEFVPGIDLMIAMCDMVASASSSPAVAGGGPMQHDGSPTAAFGDDGLRVFLLGGKPGSADAAAVVLRNKFPSLSMVGTQHGYFSTLEEPSVIDRVREAKPALLFVGLGMPAQEKWIAKHLTALGVPVVMGVGGSFDVLSGRLAARAGVDVPPGCRMDVPAGSGTVAMAPYRAAAGVRVQSTEREKEMKKLNCALALLCPRCRGPPAALSDAVRVCHRRRPPFGCRLTRRVWKTSWPL